VPEQQHELLQKSHFQQHEGHAQRSEITEHAPSAGSRRHFPPPGHPQRQQYQQPTEHYTLQPGSHQHRIAHLHQRQSAPPLQAQDFRHGAPGKKTAEIGVIIIGRHDIEFVTPVEFFAHCRRTAQGDESIRKIIPVQAMVRNCTLTVYLAPGPLQIESVVFGEGLQRCHLACGKRAALHHQHRRLPASQQCQVTHRMRHAFLRQRLDCRSSQLDQVARGDLDPAVEHHLAFRRKVMEIGAESLYRVQIIFRQPVQPGRCGAHGIGQRQHDQVIDILAARDITACLTHMQPHPGILKDMPGIGRIFPGGDCCDICIQLDRIHP